MAKSEADVVETTANGVGPRTRAEAGTRDLTCRTVRLRGLTPIMFDRYPGDNETKLEVWQKLNYMEDGKTICLPAASIMSYLSAQNTDSAPKRLLDSRTYKKFTQACGAYVSIAPLLIPFTREGKPIVFGKFSGDVDKLSGTYIDRRTARLEKGIPNPKVRPVVPLPWELEFQLTLYPNRLIQEQQLMNIFTEGGISVAFGTNRPSFGKFAVTHWE